MIKFNPFKSKSYRMKMRCPYQLFAEQWENLKMVSCLSKRALGKGIGERVMGSACFFVPRRRICRRTAKGGRDQIWCGVYPIAPCPLGRVAGGLKRHEASGAEGGSMDRTQGSAPLGAAYL